MLSRVEAVRGYDERLSALAVVTALWGNEPEVPAARMAKLVAMDTDDKTGLEVKVLSTGFMVARLFSAAGRLLSGKGLGIKKLQIISIEPPREF